MENTTKRTPEDFAKNYAVIKEDGLYGPFVVGNIKHGVEGRTIINICVKTPQSKERGATASFPDDWAIATRFSTGDMVNVTVVDGFIKKIVEAKPKSAISAADINKQVAKAESEVAESTQDETVTEGVASEASSEDQPF